MGKVTGFLDYNRVTSKYRPVEERLGDHKEFLIPLPESEIKIRVPAVWIVVFLIVMPWDVPWRILFRNGMTAFTKVTGMRLS